MAQAMDFDPQNLSEPVHVFEIRAMGGSSEQLLLAAYDLLAATPGFDIRRRSHVWTTPATDVAPGYVSLGLRVHASKPAQLVIERARAIEALLRSGDAVPAHARRLAIDLLWSAAPRGQAGGRVVSDPALATRASAACMVWEVASGIKDAEGAPIERFLETAPAPYPERPHGLPLVPRHELSADDGERIVTSWGRDRTDLLAQAGAVLGAVVGGPGEARATEVIDIEVTVPANDDDTRLLRWLRAVADVIENFPFRATRAVIFDDGAEVIHGAVLGATLRGEPPGAAIATDVHIEDDPGPLPLRASFRLRSS